MRRVVLGLLVAFGVWLIAAVGTGLYFAATGGHGGNTTVILVSVVVGVFVLGFDALPIRRIRTARQVSG